MFPLHGLALKAHGFDGAEPRQVIRLRSPGCAPSNHRDIAIIHKTADLEEAARSGFSRVAFIGDGLLELSGQREFHDFLVLPNQFDYIADGDLIGLHIPSRRFRTLYRRSSTYNSFLVTERCNHYCLMCSQPPRDVDDAWIYNEISEALPLVHPDTTAFTFTGGEPLLEWRRLIGLLELCRSHLRKRQSRCSRMDVLSPAPLWQPLGQK